MATAAHAEESTLKIESVVIANIAAFTAERPTRKPPSNVHSCCNLVRTNENSSGVCATESSPYIVKDVKVRDRVVMMAGPSLGRGRAVVPSQIEAPSLDILQDRFKRVVDCEGG